jgi:hypothetical protein
MEAVGNVTGSVAPSTSLAIPMEHTKIASHGLAFLNRDVEASFNKRAIESHVVIPGMVLIGLVLSLELIVMGVSFHVLFPQGAPGGTIFPFHSRSSCAHEPQCYLWAPMSLLELRR